MRVVLLTGRILTVIASAGLVAAMPAFAGPASATVTCPTVGPVSHLVTPAPSPGVDWSGCDLTNANLNSADLVGADLSQAELPGADLEHADLVDVTLDQANLSGAALAAASLQGTSMFGVNLAGAESGFITGTPVSLPVGWRLIDGYLVGAGADLSSAGLQDADLSGANLTGVTLTHASLSGANLTDATLTTADINGAFFDGATLTGVISGGITGTPETLPSDWILATSRTQGGFLAGPGANLAGDDLIEVNFGSVDLAGADLAGATATGLPGANLTGANLTGAVIHGSLYGANLTDANLTGADLSKVMLGTANVTGAEFARADLDGVAGWGLTGKPASLPAHWALRDHCLIGPGAVLRDASLTGADLDRTDLAGADLTGAFLADSNLTRADLAGASLAGVNLDGANLTKANLDQASLSGALLSGTIWSDTTCPDGTNSDLYTAGCLSRRLYGFGGFSSPLPDSTLPAGARTIKVRFGLVNPAGQPITSTTAIRLASHHKIRVSLRGPGITTAVAYCGWTAGAHGFRCQIDTPSGIKTGKSRRYLITVTENLGTGFLTAPAAGQAVNPEVVHFR
ncbi:MAG TPA: pentapeptide repeat-containing protein [Streptosporangiaceae bacterium]|nr:pentapeptide repeat-containing protein [Streptosporangiaceae bacterium]